MKIIERMKAFVKKEEGSKDKEFFEEYMITYF
jgi:hypothetical protein